MCIQLIKRYKLKYKFYNNKIEISNDEIKLKTLYLLMTESLNIT